MTNIIVCPAHIDAALILAQLLRPFSGWECPPQPDDALLFSHIDGRAARTGVIFSV